MNHRMRCSSLAVRETSRFSKLILEG